MDTWKSYFDFAFRYTSSTFLPPFVSKSKYRFGYMTTLLMISCFIRSVLIITEDGKTNFDAYYVAIQTAHISLRSIVFMCQRKSFNKIADQVSRILQTNHRNHMETDFKDLWDRKKPLRFVKYYYFGQTFSYVLWLLQTLYRIYWGDKNATESPLPFYTPMYKWGEYYKTFSVICDTICVTMLFFQILQPDIATISLLNFASCLLIYLKLLLKEMIKNDYSENNKRFWIRKHAKVLNFMEDLDNLLKPHIAIQYCCQVGAIVLTLLSLLEENTTQSFGQKLMSTIVVVGSLMILGYECNIFEQISEAHGSMYVILLRHEIICNSKKESSFLKMLILRSNKPLSISGYVFKMNNENYKDLITNAYKFYSSLFSLKK